MPLKIKIKVLGLISTWLILCVLTYYLLNWLGLTTFNNIAISFIPYTIIGLYSLYKFYPKFDVSPDIAFNKKERTVAITFDDGPTKGFTDKILEILKEKSVPATFFVLEPKAKKNIPLLEKAILQNCEIGAHTKSHKKLHNSCYNEIVSEVAPCIELIENLYLKLNKKNDFKKILRTPHGFKNIWLKIYTKKSSIKLIPWTRGVWDTDAPGSTWIEQKAIISPRKNEILLLHDGLGLKDEVSPEQQEGVLKALPKIIDFYRTNGYTFVKVSKFIKK